MPQLITDYWVNQLGFTLIGLSIITYIVSIYVLPPVLEILVSRVYITKL